MARFKAAAGARTTGSRKAGGGTKGVTLTGTESAETLIGTERNDTLDGRGGADILRGVGGSDYLIGGTGDDQLDGGTGADQMDGGAGNDIYVVDDANDFVIERVDGGTDTILSSVSYALSFDLENLALQGNAAIDGTGNYRDNEIFGNAAANSIDGREGNDLIDGKGGNDVLTGGLGADTFAFTTAPGAANVDRILDFQSGVDRIALDDAVFGGLVPGGLAPGAFAIGSAAGDADDRIIYDASTGALMFDADGNGSGAAVTFAVLQPNLNLTAADFFVI